MSEWWLVVYHSNNMNKQLSCVCVDARVSSDPPVFCCGSGNSLGQRQPHHGGLPHRARLRGGLAKHHGQQHLASRPCTGTEGRRQDLIFLWHAVGGMVWWNIIRLWTQSLMLWFCCTSETLSFYFSCFRLAYPSPVAQSIERRPWSFVVQESKACKESLAVLCKRFDSLLVVSVSEEQVIDWPLFLFKRLRCRFSFCVNWGILMHLLGEVSMCIVRIFNFYTLCKDGLGILWEAVLSLVEMAA